MRFWINGNYFDKKKYTNIEIYGCVYHLTKTFHKKNNELSFASSYRNDADFSIFIKIIIAFSFVPVKTIMPINGWFFRMLTTFSWLVWK